MSDLPWSCCCPLVLARRRRSPVPSGPASRPGSWVVPDQRDPLHGAAELRVVRGARLRRLGRVVRPRCRWRGDPARRRGRGAARASAGRPACTPASCSPSRRRGAAVMARRSVAGFELRAVGAQRAGVQAPRHPHRAGRRDLDDRRRRPGRARRRHRGRRGARPRLEGIQSNFLLLGIIIGLIARGRPRGARSSRSASPSSRSAPARCSAPSARPSRSSSSSRA